MNFLKSNRHSKILELIEKYDIDTQEELLKRLKEDGFEITQATVSRDINELHLVKAMTAEGFYKYQLSVNGVKLELKTKYISILSDCVLNVDYAGNTAVIKCHDGMAMAAAAALDGLHFDAVVGTLAGDNTIFALCKTEKKAVEFTNKLMEFTKK